MRIVVWVVVAVVVSGCATWFRSKHQGVVVTTDPPGGTIIYEGQRHQTPVTLSLRRNREHVVYVERDGQPVIAAIIDADHTSAGWMIIGCLTLFGAFTDIMTGALATFPDQVKLPEDRSKVYQKLLKPGVIQQ